MCHVIFLVALWFTELLFQTRAPYTPRNQQARFARSAGVKSRLPAVAAAAAVKLFSIRDALDEPTVPGNESATIVSRIKFR